MTKSQITIFEMVVCPTLVAGFSNRGCGTAPSCAKLGLIYQFLIGTLAGSKGTIGLCSRCRDRKRIHARLLTDRPTTQFEYQSTSPTKLSPCPCVAYQRRQHYSAGACHLIRLPPKLHYHPQLWNSSSKVQPRRWCLRAIHAILTITGMRNTGGGFVL